MKQILIKLAALGLPFSVLSLYDGQNCGCTPPPEEASSNVEALPSDLDM